jgi:hypothetical protein
VKTANLVFLAFAGCASAPRPSAPAPRPEFILKPWTFAVKEAPEVLVPVAAQRAAELGMEPVEVEKDKGVVKVRAKWVDEWGCDDEWAKAAERIESGHSWKMRWTIPPRPIVSRVLEVTSVLVNGRATVSASSRTCIRTSAGKRERCGEPSTALVQRELDSVRAIGMALQGDVDGAERVFESVREEP